MSSRRSSSSSSSRPDSPALFSAFAQAHSHSQQQQQQQQQLQLRPLHQAQASQPQQPPPPPRNQKADHILQNFYVKVIQIVVLARVTHPDPSSGPSSRRGTLRGAPLVRKTSKWFNLELEELDIYKEDAKFWRAMAITESPPVMLVELLLDTSELAPNQMLMLVDDSNRRKRVEMGPSSTATTPLGLNRSRRNIILESWSLAQSNTPPDPAPEPPVVYKKSIIFFRSLYAYMRLLPAYQLYKRLRRQNLPLKIGFRVSRGQAPEESMFRDSDIGIEVPLIEGETRPSLSEYRFGQVETPLGAFSLKVTYRSNCEFHVDESEASIYRLNDMDENYFTPTIVTHSQESVMSSGRPSFDGRRPAAPSPLPRRSSSDLYNSGNYQDQFTPLQSLGHRRSSIQSFQQRSGEYSSSQSSVSSLGARGSRRETSGAPGALFTSVDAQNPGSTPPFSTHGGSATASRNAVDVIMESPPPKLASGSQRPLSSNFSPFKTPSLSSSPSPSYLEPVNSSLSSRPPSIKMGRSPSTSSMNRVQSSQLGSGLLSSTQRAGTATPTSAGAFNLQSGSTAVLSSSVKSNASSSTSAPRVASIFSHRHDGRRSSSESLPGGRNRSSIIGSSSLFQFTPDDDDVSSFVRMLDTPEPLKMFGKTTGSSIEPSFGFGEASLSASAMKAKSTLDRFQQLKQVNAELSDSMSASQILSKEQAQQSSAHSRPHGPSNLTIATGHLSRRATLSDIGTTSPTSSAFATTIPSAISRHSQSLSHQPGTPSPLHSEVPLYPLTSSGLIRPSSSSVHASGHSRTGSTPTKRYSWLQGADGSHGKGSNMGSIAFRHGSLDQGKDIFGMEEAMGKIGITGSTEIAFGSFPEDVHHQHSRYSAPLQTGRGTSDRDLSSGADPRPIPPPAAASSTTSSRPSGRLLRLGSGSSGTSVTLPRLRNRVADDNESLDELNSASRMRGHQHGGRSKDQFEGDDEDEEDDEDQDDSGSIERRPSQDEKSGHNTSLNDDDDMLFIMSELSPGSTPATQYQSMSPETNAVYPGAGGTAAFLPSSAPTERGMLPLTGAMMNLRSQSQSPAMGPHGSPYHPSSGNAGPASSTSSSPHYRLFGRNPPMSGNIFNSNSNNSSSSRSNSISHSRGGSNSGSNTNGQNSVENLHLLRRSFSGSGVGSMEDVPGHSPSLAANLRLGTAPPLLPPLPPAITPGVTSYPYDSSILEGRRMSRTGSDRGVTTSGHHTRNTSASGANSNGHNSFHSDPRGGQREGW